MRDKLLQIRVDEDFLSKLEYLRKINGFKSIAETVRKIIEKEFRKEIEKMKEVSNNHIHLCQSCYKEFPNCDADNNDIMFGDGTGNDNICCCNKYIPIMERDTDRGGYK